MIIDQLCPFCFSFTNGVSPCPACHHYKGEPREDMQTLPPGTILDGKFILGMVLGRGGFGITYLAYDLNLNQKIAIKEYFPSSLVSRQRQYVVPNIQADAPVFKRGVESFFMEAQTLAKFQYHPNIVKILSFFEENNTAYIVMEYVEGIPLSQYLERAGGHLNTDYAIELMMPVFDALEQLHASGTLHRDLAPDNIYIDQHLQPKILDFGTAKNLSDQSVRSTSAVIKPGYAPVEQYSKNGEQGPWTDIYAMGAVLYKLISGRTPVGAPDRMTGTELPSLSELGCEINPGVDNTIMQAMELYSENRWQSIREFREALLDPPEISSETDRNWILIIIASVLVVILICIGIGYYFLNSENNDLSDLLPTAPDTSTPTLTYTPMDPYLMTAIYNIDQGRTATAWFFLTPSITPTPTTTMTPTPTLASGDKRIRLKDDMPYLYVPGGKFKKGVYGSQNIDVRSFWIDEHEVTREQYKKCMDEGACENPLGASSYGDYWNTEYLNYAADRVTWEQAYTYCTWAGGILPDDDQWEKAARGTDGRRFPWGEGYNTKLLNSKENGSSDLTVGRFLNGASPYGALDMAGNVMEWTSNQTRIEGNRNCRSIRGGSYSQPLNLADTSTWDCLAGELWLDGLGFRCSMDGR